MASTVDVSRAARHEEYVRLRLKIFAYYDVLALVGASPGAKAHKLPPKLGHWSWRHSELVREVGGDPLLHIVQRIESLLEQRKPSYIKARHTPLRRGDNFRRKNSGGKPREPRVQLNPGEWPPRYK